MRSRALFAAIVCLLGSVAAFGQGRGRQEAPPPTDKVTPAIPGIVPAGTKIEVVKFGMQGADGVNGMADGSLILTANGGVAKVDTDGNLTMLVEKSGQAAGLAVDAQGRVIAAQYTGKVSVLYPPEAAKVLADNFEGKPFLRPNDLVVDKKGGVYFTDCYQAQAKPQPGDLPQTVYYIPANGKIMRVSTDINRPNGITLSPDEKILYVNDWDGNYLVAYDVQADGSLKNRRDFGKFDVKQDTDHGLVSGADGLCIDNESNTYATTPAGVQIFNKKGEHLGNIEVPLELPSQNCGFGGPDKHYLYVVGRGVIFRIHTIPAGYTGRAK
jgi:gluconolactonase